MNWPSPGTDPWYAANPTEGLASRSFYAGQSGSTIVNATPTIKLDGAAVTVSSTGITAAIAARRQVASPLWFDINSTMNANGDSVVTIVRVVGNTAVTASHILRMAMVEPHEVWPAPAPNGQTSFDFNVVKFAPGPTGQAFTHSGLTTDTMSYRGAFPLRLTGPEPWWLDNAAVIVWVRNETTKEVLQTGYKNVSNLRSPIGREIAIIGDSLPIRWYANAFTSNVNIELNRTYPTGTWETILSNVANTGTTSWLISGTASTTARIRVSGVNNPDETGMSMLNFSLTSPTTVTCTPNPITASINAGATGQTQITITNTGTAPLAGTLEASLGQNGFAYSTVTPNFVDASAGTAGPMGDDAMGGPYPLPFSFPFFGNTYGEVYMCTNGFLSFASFNAASSYTNAAFPQTLATTLVAPYWDDLNITSGSTYAYMDTANHRAVFSWVNVPQYNVTGSNLTFQAILYEDGRIVFNYGALTGTLNSATIGLQGSATGYTQVLYNSTVTANNAYRFSTQFRWGTASTTTLSIPAAGQTQVTLNWDASNFTADTTLVGSLRVTGNLLPTTFPVSLTLRGLAAEEPVVLPNTFAMSEAYPNPFNPTTTLKFSLASASPVSMKLYDVTGRLSATLFEGTLPAGEHIQSVKMDQFATGTYFVQFEAGDKFSAVRKLVLMK